MEEGPGGLGRAEEQEEQAEGSEEEPSDGRWWLPLWPPPSLLLLLVLVLPLVLWACPSPLRPPPRAPRHVSNRSGGPALCESIDGRCGDWVNHELSDAMRSRLSCGYVRSMSMHVSPSLELLAGRCNGRRLTLAHQNPRRHPEWEGSTHRGA